MKFGLAFDKRDEKSMAIAREITKILKDSKQDVVLESKVPGFQWKTKIASIRSMNVDIVILIGDSFNVLRTFKELDRMKVLVLSVTTSSTNFFSEITADQFPKALEKIQNGDYTVEEYSRLEAKADGAESSIALNDVVITAGKSATIMSYEVIIDGKLIFRDAGDGVIISTPIGSTGYSSSAGGPVVFSNAKVFIVTPISSLNQNKPFVVRDSSDVLIKSIQCPTGVEVVTDGRFRAKLKGEEVLVNNADAPAEFIRFKEFSKNVFDKLKKRMPENGNLPQSAPPSAKFLFKILQYEGALTQKELIQMSAMPSRTVRSGLSYLLKSGIIEEQRALRDARYSVYYIKSS
jgi:NAD+ kinase